MPADLIALGHRAIAAEGWRWMQGMATTDGFVITSAFDGDVTQYVDHKGYQTTAGEQTSHEDLRAFVAEYWLPDLDDDATKGCVLRLIREAHNDPTIGCHYDHEDGGWVVGRWEADGVAIRGRGTIEAEALISALEAK